MQNFEYYNPTRLIFGRGEIASLTRHIPEGVRVLVTFGGGSVKRNGVYDQVKAALADIDHVEFWGIEANPKVETLRKCIEFGREQKAGFILAVGGGSVLDGSKLVACALTEGETRDAWDIVLSRRPARCIPYASVMTLPATGSEMNANSVISRLETKEKLAFVAPENPRFSILDPECCRSLGAAQVAASLADITAHVLEQYMTEPGQSRPMDRWAEGLLLKLVDIAREFGLIIFADEVYDKILYEDAKHIAIASLSTDVLTITFNSLSKAYRACGYRAGWMIISGNKLPARDFIEGLNMLANMKLCANVPGQWAIQTALGGYQSINDLVCEGGRLRVQRDLAWELLTQIPGVTCVKPQGSLYMFPRLDPKIYPIENDRQFFKELLEATRVLLVQGTGFNWPHPDHFRVVFLPHEPQLREAISRIAEYLAAWRAAHPVKEEPATPRKKEGAAE